MTKPLDEMELQVQRLSREMEHRRALEELAMEWSGQTGYTNVVSFADGAARRRARRRVTPVQELRPPVATKPTEP
jgi:hypothetical protein